MVAALPDGSNRPAGYSTTGTVKKLGIKASTAAVVVDAPADWTIPGLPSDVGFIRRRSGDVSPLPVPCTVVAFFRSAADLHGGIADLSLLVWPATALWAAWPRRAGGQRSDLTDNIVRDAALALGLVDNKVAAIDEDWSGLRFVWRKEHRDHPPVIGG